MSETQEVWTVLKLLNWTQEFFKKKNIDSARLDAEILLAHVLKYERVFLYVNYEQPLTALELAEFKKLISAVRFARNKSSRRRKAPPAEHLKTINRLRQQIPTLRFLRLFRI